MTSENHNGQPKAELQVITDRDRNIFNGDGLSLTTTTSPPPSTVEEPRSSSHQRGQSEELPRSSSHLRGQSKGLWAQPEVVKNE